MNHYKLTYQEIIERISRHCPDALSTYLQCTNRADQKGAVFFSKDMVRNDMSYSWTKFINQIKKLALENLLEWHPLDGGVAVTLGDIYENE